MKKFLIPIIIFFGLTSTALASDRYWVPAGTGNFNSTTNWSATDGGPSGASVPTNTDDCYWDSHSASSSAQTVTVNVGSKCKLISFTGGSGGTIGASNFVGTFAGSSQLTASSSLAFSSTMVRTYTGNLILTGESGTFTITSNGGTGAEALIIRDKSAGTAQFADAYSSTGVLTLTNGTLDGNSKNITAAGFTSNNSNTRVLTLGSTGTPSWTLTGSGTPWNTTTTTGLTVSSTTAIVNLTDATSSTKGAAVGTVGIDYGGMGFTFSGSGTGAYTFSGISTNVGNVLISNSGAAGFTETGTGKTMANLTFTSYTGQFTCTNAPNITGNLSFSSGMTMAAGGAALVMAATSGTKTVTTNGVQITLLSINNTAGVTTQLADNLSMSGAFTLTQGTFDSNAKTVSSTTFAANNTNTKVLTITNSTWTLTGTGTIWNMNASGTTLSATGSTITSNDATASTKIFNFGTGLTYGNLYLTGGGTGIFQLGNAANTVTFVDLKSDAGMSIQFFAGSTTNVTTFTMNSTSASKITLASTTATSAWNLAKNGGGTINVDWLSIQDSAATPANTWYANHSTNVSNNTGWIFGPFPTPPVANVLIRGL